MFPVGSKTDLERLRFRPLAGVGCFMSIAIGRVAQSGFPSPCGVWVVSKNYKGKDFITWFSSPCGVWVVSKTQTKRRLKTSFRPLAGCGLFPSGRCLRHGLSGVSVPLRGVGCFSGACRLSRRRAGFRPLAGCGLFPSEREIIAAILVSVPLRGVGCFFFYSCNCPADSVSVPLRGVGCFLLVSIFKIFGGFPSPCGVWVVSLHYDTDH